MQRGKVRRRSSSDSQGGDSERSHQRPRLSHNRPSASTSTAIVTTSTDEPPSSPSRVMGPPRTGNGVHNGSGATEHAHQGNPLLDQVERFYPLGELMYPDDADWTNEDDAEIAAESGDTPEDRLDKARRQQKYGRRMPVNREEIVRLMLQGLQDIGYKQAAAVLAKESGYSLATPAALDFQEAVLGGRWFEATALLPELGLETSGPVASEASSSSSSVMSGKVRAAGQESPMDRAQFLIAKQKYLEYLEAGHQKKALGVLRNELAASATDSEALHDLSGFMMCLDRDDLYERAKWDGAAGISRRQLLERLQEHISPQVMVPSRRLATLLDQARQHQKQACLYHDDMDPISLYHDHVCKSGSFPSVTTHVLADHHDEVWRIEWSPNGNMLASASKDKTVVIWQLQPPAGGKRQYSMAPLHRLKGHRGPVDALAWSPDGETLVTAADKQIYIWNAKTGEKSPVTAETQLADTVSAIQWMPDGSQFVVSSMDCTIIFFELSGKIAHKWLVRSLQISDFAITPDGTRIVAVTTAMRRVSVQNKLKPTISARIIEDDFHYGNMNRGLTVMRIADREIIDYVADIKASDVTSLKLSHDGQRVLVSCAPDELQLFGLDPHLHMLRKFVGHVQSRFLIRSAFGAPKDRFILSGSEDGNVYVWQSNSTTPLEVLAGHDDTVNAVAWNPILSRKLFASCSDDATIRIWQPPIQEEKSESVESEDDGMEL